MSVSIDGLSVLTCIANDSSAFGDAKAEIQKAALTIPIAQLKSEKLTLDGVSAIQRALGEQNFRLILEHLPDSVLNRLLKKLDAYHPELKTGGGLWGRKHLVALAKGATKPAPKPERLVSKKKTAPTKSKAKKTAAWPTSTMAVGSRRK